MIVIRKMLFKSSFSAELYKIQNLYSGLSSHQAFRQQNYLLLNFFVNGHLTFTPPFILSHPMALLCIHTLTVYQQLGTFFYFSTFDFDNRYVTKLPQVFICVPILCRIIRKYFQLCYFKRIYIANEFSFTISRIYFTLVLHTAVGTI